MLWIFVVVGGGVATIMAIFTIGEIVGATKYTDWSKIDRHFVRFFIFAVIELVGCFGLIGIGTLSYEEVVQTNDWKLVSLTDNSEISGSGSSGLFYVHVSIDTDEVYSFYYKVNNGGVKRGKVDADYTTIYEKDDCTPHIVEHTTYTKNKMNKILMSILTFGYYSNPIQPIQTSQKTYEIYTPTGTILRTFSQDAQ